MDIIQECGFEEIKFQFIIYIQRDKYIGVFMKIVA